MGDQPWLFILKLYDKANTFKVYFETERFCLQIHSQTKKWFAILIAFSTHFCDKNHC